ncbi:MAG: hypothetical protein WDO18_00405 [Acidobacteriota bacterium]
MNSHLQDDQLIAHLYGVSDGSTQRHLDNCPECQSRWAAMEQRRVAMPKHAAPSDDLLARQRHAVMTQAGRPRPVLSSPWIPATAGVLAIAGILLLRPVHVPPVTPELQDSAQVLQAGWFDETYASISMEPRAGSPLRGLFDEGAAQ